MPRPESGEVDRTAERVGLIAAVVVLLAFAVVRLNTTSLWLDEAWSLAATQKLGMSLRATNGTMSAYYVPLWLWARVSTATWWLRLLSTVFAIGTLVVVSRLARRVGGSRLAAIAPLLLVASPMFLWKATEARAYGLETLVVACTWLVLFRAVEAQHEPDGRAVLRWSIVLGLLAAVGPLVHGLYILELFGVVAVLLLGDIRAGLRIIAPAFLASLVATLVLLATGSKDYGAALPGSVAHLFADGGDWFLSAIERVALIVLVVLVAGIVACTAQAVRARSDIERMDRAMPLAWVIVPVAAILVERAVHGVYVAYYLAPIAPGIALLLGCGALALDDLLLRRRARTTRPALLGPVVVATVGLLLVAQVQHPLRPGEDWRGAARLVAAETRSGDAIVFVQSPIVESRTAFEAAWREVRHPLVPTALSPARPLGRAQREDTFLTPAQVAERARRYSRIWVVDIHGVIDDKHLVSRAHLTTSFHKAVDRTFEGGIRVLRYDANAP